jgi:hypothetical protein
VGPTATRARRGYCSTASAERGNGIGNQLFPASTIGAPAGLLAIGTKTDSFLRPLLLVAIDRSLLIHGRVSLAVVFRHAFQLRIVGGDAFGFVHVGHV